MAESSSSNQEWAGSNPVPKPMPPQQPLSPHVPAEIGGFRIQRVLGAGGMATVYAAMQKQPRRVVAIKVMKAGLSGSGSSISASPSSSATPGSASANRADAAARRFKREIEILGKLRHPFIAQVYGAGVYEDTAGASVPYFVMEYVPGAKTIIEYIAARQLELRERLKLFVKVCAAVEHGHRHKVIHRDLKPANILIDENGDPKIIDFGVAHALPGAAIETVSSQTMHTEAGRLVGTLQYMSPEQLDHKEQDLDARCDVYALGVLLYKMLTGKPPHDLEALPVYEAVRIIREETPRNPGAVKPELKGDLETIILKAMEPDRARRYRNAGSLGRDVIRYLANKPIHARRASWFYQAGLFARRHRAALTSGGIVAMVMSIALVVVLVNRGRSPGERTTDVADGADRASQSAESAPSAVIPPVVGEAPVPAREPFTLYLHAGTISQLTFAADGQRLFSAGHDKALMVWDLPTKTQAAAIYDLPSAVKWMSLNEDGSFLLAAGGNGPVWVIDGRTIDAGQFGLNRGETLRIDLPSDEMGAAAAALSPDAAKVAIGLDDFTLRIASIENRSPTIQSLASSLTVRSASGPITAAAFHPNGETIAAGSERGVVYQWNVGDGSLTKSFSEMVAARSAIVEVRFIDDGDRLIALARDGSATVWDLRVEGAAPPVPFNACQIPLSAAAFDQTGRWLACASDKIIALWDLEGQFPKEIGAPIEREEVVYALGLDSIGGWCAIGQGNGDIAFVPVKLN